MTCADPKLKQMVVFEISNTGNVQGYFIGEFQVYVDVITAMCVQGWLNHFQFQLVFIWNNLL